MEIVNTVEELINVLSKYPKDKKIHSNAICENLKGELILTHKTTLEVDGNNIKIKAMRQEDKELLLKDLCAIFPYGVIRD